MSGVVPWGKQAMSTACIAVSEESEDKAAVWKARQNGGSRIFSGQEP